MRRVGVLLLVSTLTGCGREPEKPFEPWRANDPPGPSWHVVIKTGAPGNPRPTLPADPRPPPVESPRPEAGLPPALPLSAEEAELVGTYRLREFIAMSGQVPGPDGRINGSLALTRDGRRVTLHVTHGGLSDRYMGGGEYFGGGRWRLSGEELVFEPFVVGKGEPLLGPWVARWKVVREAGNVLLKAGEFTYERVPEK